MTGETAPARKSPDHLIGETLANRYLIEQKLGEGAMGTVYRARHVKVGRSFAVKVLHAKALDDDKVAARFERESELAGRLSHANVVGVVDVGDTPDGLKYMVMDFAEGEDLANMLADAPFPAARIILLTRQMLEGLYHAHEAGLIHRDFKPENVIIARDDHGMEVPRIVDFGIAILREGGDSASSEGRLTTNGLVLGTPHYMAPEQAVADPIDHRIDLFALGIVIYEMLCGKLPFDGTGAEVARANLLLDPPPISTRVPYLEVDPLLEALSRKLMAKKREQRPPTARAARELLDLIEKEPAKAAEILGVQDQPRVPAVTQPRQPVRDTEPEEDLALPVSVRAPTPAPVADPRQRATSMAEPLEWQPKRDRRVLIAIIGALAVVAIVVFFAMKHKSTPDPEPTVAVVTPTPPVTPPVEKPAVIPDPAPTEIEMPVVSDAGKAPIPVIPKKPVVAKADVPPRPVVETPPLPPAGAPTTDDVNALYGAVARELGALSKKKGADAAAGLWKRYRMIQIQDATHTPAGRAEVSSTLTKIRRDAASTK